MFTPLCAMVRRESQAIRRKSRLRTITSERNMAGASTHYNTCHATVVQMYSTGRPQQRVVPLLSVCCTCGSVQNICRSTSTSNPIGTEERKRTTVVHVYTIHRDCEEYTSVNHVRTHWCWRTTAKRIDAQAFSRKPCTNFQAASIIRDQSGILNEYQSVPPIDDGPCSYI